MSLATWLIGSSFAFAGQISNVTRYALAHVRLRVLQQIKFAVCTGCGAKSVASRATPWHRRLQQPPQQQPQQPQPQLLQLLLPQQLQLPPQQLNDHILLHYT